MTSILIKGIVLLRSLHASCPLPKAQLSREGGGSCPDTLHVLPLSPVLPVPPSLLSLSLLSLSLSLSLSLFLCLSLCLFLSELKGEEGWSRLKYFRTFPVAKELIRDTCERISYFQVDEREFIERFEKPRCPVVITDSQLDWPGTKKWTIEVRAYTQPSFDGNTSDTPSCNLFCFPVCLSACFCFSVLPFFPHPSLFLHVAPLCLSLSLSVSVSACLSVCLSICLSPPPPPLSVVFSLSPPFTLPFLFCPICMSFFVCLRAFLLSAETESKVS